MHKQGFFTNSPNSSSSGDLSTVVLLRLGFRGLNLNLENMVVKAATGGSKGDIRTYATRGGFVHCVVVVSTVPSLSIAASVWLLVERRAVLILCRILSTLCFIFSPSRLFRDDSRLIRLPAASES
jgi:hypothetical protein